MHLSALNKRSIVGAFLTCTISLLAACGDNATQTSVTTPAESVKVVSTAFGEVTIPEHPERVVALEGAIGPVLDSGLVPVATADGDRNENLLPEEQEAVKGIPAVLGPDGWDYEQIAATDPDLLIGMVRAGKVEEISPQAKEEYEKLKEIAPTVLILSKGAGSAKEASLQVAEIIGSGDAAKAAKKEYEVKAAQIKKKYADKLAEYTFAPIDHFEGTVTVYTPISWLGSVITDMGGTMDPVSANINDVNGVDISTEELSTLSPKSIILTEKDLTGAPGIGAEELEGIPTFQELAAVKDNHNYGIQYFFTDRYETASIVLDQLEEILLSL